MTDSALKKAAQELCRQIEINDFTDSHGHKAAMLKAFHDLRAALSAPEPTQEQSLAEWAVSRWNAEVLYRPMQNIHRRTLDNVWRQVIRHVGADPSQLLPLPPHDDILAAAKKEPKK